MNNESVKDLVSIGCQALISSFSPPCEFESPVKVDGFLGKTTLGAFTYIQKGSFFIDTDVGRFCSIAMNVSTGAGEHPVDWLSSHPFVNDPNDVAAGLSNCYPEYREWLTGAPTRVTNRGGERVTIGNDVWIGEGAFVRRGVTIGTGAIVAAHAVVTKDVAPFSIVGGNPAKHIRYRIAEGLIDEVLQSQWWEFDLRPIIAGIDFSDVRASVAKINEARADGRIERFLPSRYRVGHDGAKLM
ncbi:MULTISPECIES: CatB-related O-acetyltransferase [Sphingobium]|uniref:CatB-related O-acetyltransferase n=1 Tax=Sphingobium TaxID=165695 RepID=UPI00159C552F|nr:CatB-related O-acetyltransferase [Sphingobium sp. 15-1]